MASKVPLSSPKGSFLLQMDLSFLQKDPFYSKRAHFGSERCLFGYERELLTLKRAISRLPRGPLWLPKGPYVSESVIFYASMEPLSAPKGPLDTERVLLKMAPTPTKIFVIENYLMKYFQPFRRIVAQIRLVFFWGGGLPWGPWELAPSPRKGNPATAFERVSAYIGTSAGHSNEAFIFADMTKSLKL